MSSDLRFLRPCDDADEMKTRFFFAWFLDRTADRLLDVPDGTTSGYPDELVQIPRDSDDDESVKK